MCYIEKVQDWNALRLPVSFCNLVFSICSLDFELDHSIQFGQCNVGKYNANGGLKSTFTLRLICSCLLPLPWEPSQTSLLKDEGHTEQNWVVPVISATATSDQLTTSWSADMLVIQHYCDKHNHMIALTPLWNATEWGLYAMINSVSFIGRTVVDLICFGWTELDESYYFHFLKGNDVYLISNR